MPMIPFYTKCPDIAEADFRAAKITGDPKIPDGEYGFLELYCDEAGCDCRRVFVQVLSPPDKDSGPLATINYGWESEEFYRDWMHASPDDETIAEVKGPSLAMASQSEFAPYFLELFEDMLEDPAYVARLRRHYKLFRQAVDRESIPSGFLDASATVEQPGPNKPCHCGSGKKFKKCCGNSKQAAR